VKLLEIQISFCAFCTIKRVTFNMPICERIENLCVNEGISITQLCEEVTGSRGNLSTWRKGNVRNDYLIKIAKRFNVSTDYLLGETDKPLPIASEGLTSEEIEYIKLYRQASPEMQVAALAMLEAAEKARLTRDASGEDK